MRSESASRLVSLAEIVAHDFHASRVAPSVPERVPGRVDPG